MTKKRIVSYGGAVAATFLWCVTLFPARAAGNVSYRTDVIRTSWNTFEFRLHDAPGAPPLAVLWRWNDGLISGDRVAVRTFPGPGEYTVTMEVTDASGTTSKTETPVSISFFDASNWLVWALVGGLVVVSIGSVILATRLRR